LNGEFEFQSRHDLDKLDVTSEEAGVLRGHARRGDDRKGKSKVLTARSTCSAAARRIEWNCGLEGFEMTESQVVNEWISQGEVKGRVTTRSLQAPKEISYLGSASRE
jgi:hypothetical protein